MPDIFEGKSVQELVSEATILLASIGSSERLTPRLPYAGALGAIRRRLDRIEALTGKRVVALGRKYAEYPTQYWKYDTDELEESVSETELDYDLIRKQRIEDALCEDDEF